jgi:hypothetical protein
METFLHIGGVVAAGFDPTGAYLLVISHSGRGVFSTNTRIKVARDVELAYPVAGIGVGIGPIDGERIAVSEMPFDIGRFSLVSSNGRITLICESDGISVHVANS